MSSLAQTTTTITEIPLTAEAIEYQSLPIDPVTHVEKQTNPKDYFSQYSHYMTRKKRARHNQAEKQETQNSPNEKVPTLAQVSN